MTGKGITIGLPRHVSPSGPTLAGAPPHKIRHPLMDYRLPLTMVRQHGQRLSVEYTRRSDGRIPALQQEYSFSMDGLRVSVSPRGEIFSPCSANLS